MLAIMTLTHKEKQEDVIFAHKKPFSGIQGCFKKRLQTGLGKVTGQ